jgi:hypothetical protein
MDKNEARDRSITVAQETLADIKALRQNQSFQRYWVRRLGGITAGLAQSILDEEKDQNAVMINLEKYRQLKALSRMMDEDEASAMRVLQSEVKK